MKGSGTPINLLIMTDINKHSISTHQYQIQNGQDIDLLTAFIIQLKAPLSFIN